MAADFFCIFRFPSTFLLRGAKKNPLSGHFYIHKTC